MKILIVIPARGGSKGIPRKNVRLINGKPLISYAIESARRLGKSYDADVVVSTDDEEIMAVAGDYGAETIIRPAEIAGDEVPLDPVVFHAVQRCESRKETQYDVVITMQPTSPALSADTLKAALDDFVRSDKDSVLSVMNKPKLSWRREEGRIVPNYTARMNRQKLPDNYEETGGFLITRRNFITEHSRLGNNIGVYEVPEDQGIDIDNELDWLACESVLRKKKIVFRVDGDEALGMGHIYRTLTLAYQLIGNDICFASKSCYPMGMQRLKESYFKVAEISDDNEFFAFLEKYQPDIIINDILNTSEEYMCSLRPLGKRIINFEDEGKGALLADAVINALYENTENRPNVYSGFEYFCIREEFLKTAPSQFHEKVRNILILFGGSDPSNLTGKMYLLCQELHEIYPEIQFHFITGFGYPFKNEIRTIADKNIYAYHDVKRVSSYMREADLAVTSQGRTIYELACMGVPAVVMAQNKRETSHVFAKIQNGFINLGLGREQDKKTLEQTLNWLIETPQIRKEMHNLQASKEFQRGIDRVKNIILDDRE